MLEHVSQFGYAEVFLALVATGFGLPIPEELPVLVAGVLTGHEETPLRWYVMLPVLFAGVVAVDFALYGAGRLWGRKLLESSFVKRSIITREVRAKLERNFADHGIVVLLGVRLLPGVRAPAFLLAGVLKVPFSRFIAAELIYAIPVVNVLFWLAYLLSEQVREVVFGMVEFNSWLPVAVLCCVAGLIVYNIAFARRGPRTGF
jgi:membrane protein DedA with SNARE-associated domain